jgi:hypothetical protein
MTRNNEEWERIAHPHTYPDRTYPERTYPFVHYPYHGLPNELDCRPTRARPVLLVSDCTTTLTYLLTYRLSHRLSIPIMPRLCRILTH